MLITKTVQASHMGRRSTAYGGPRRAVRGGNEAPRATSVTAIIGAPFGVQEWAAWGAASGRDEPAKCMKLLSI